MGTRGNIALVKAGMDDGTRQVYRADMRDVDNGELLQLGA